MAAPGERRSARPVLVVTEPDDPTADMVITELNQRSVPVVRFNPTDIGENLRLSAQFGGAASEPVGHLRTPSRSADLANVRSVYYRRPIWPEFENLDQADARFARTHVRHGLGGVLYALGDCGYVNHPLRNYDAEYKPLQLAVAQRTGFTIPPTLISNELTEIRAFIAEHDQVIHKALRWMPYWRDGQELTTWTQPVTADELDDTVAVTPHLFQARVDKTADLRVVVIGERVFAVEIRSELLDWRQDYSAVSYRVMDLPVQLSKSLVAYLEYFQLASGSFDLCLDRDGKPIWLELNPNGQWGWLEDETGLPLTAAFADRLERGAR